MSFVEQYLHETKQIIDLIDVDTIEKIVTLLDKTRKKHGRLFVLGVGGGAGNATHVVNDFRKIAGIEAYAPTDNVSELTARTNDEGWESVFVEWLKTSRLCRNDTVVVFSVGGGDLEKKISSNLVFALKYAKEVHASICGVVGRDGGYMAKVADAALIIPTIEQSRITPHTESFQMLIAHLLVSHPQLKYVETKWESVK